MDKIDRRGGGPKIVYKAGPQTLKFSQTKQLLCPVTADRH